MELHAPHAMWLPAGHARRVAGLNGGMASGSQKKVRVIFGDV